MKYLQKTWIRVLVSMVAGGAANEIFFLSTGDPTRSREGEGNGITLAVAVVVFFYPNSTNAKWQASQNR